VPKGEGEAFRWGGKKRRKRKQRGSGEKAPLAEKKGECLASRLQKREAAEKVLFMKKTRSSEKITSKN